MIRIHVHGAYGRLGQVIARLGEQTSSISRSGRSDDLEPMIRDCDVGIDVTQPEGTLAIAEVCAAYRKPLVIGTTGHSESAIQRLRALSNQVAILVAPNFSVGTNLLFWLTEEATKRLGNDFDIEILELHHRQKKDAPSGTAKRLGEIAAKARSQEPNEVFRYGRHGLVGARKGDEIGIHAMRGGDIV
ncbi:MAG: 4-hydroxy-tetrahydrodipicolinate reductase [Verrucomicrobia bacterium]|nr:4-hydroxy-tetrahydrodipicolinate reductase [Verrucomicrobiota bacterium]